MRIALVSSSYPQFEGDAAGYFVASEADLLATAGHEVHVLCPGPSSFVRGRNGRIHIWPLGGGELFGAPGAWHRLREHPARIAWLLPAVVEARRVLGRLRCDRVVAHFWLPGAFPFALSGPKTAELEVVGHGSDVRLFCRLPGRLRRRLARALVSRGATFRFVSEALLVAVVASLDTELASAVAGRARVELPPLAMPATAVLPRGRYWASVGRLIHSKRVDLGILLAASEKVRLVVVGDGPERAALERLALAQGADVRFLGERPRPEALSWIAGAARLVHLSECEGAPTVVREARALGVPVLARAVGDLRRWAAEDPGITLLEENAPVPSSPPRQHVARQVRFGAPWGKSAFMASGKPSGLTYEQAGVDYGPLDGFKRICQRMATATRSALAAHDLSEPAGVRGESAYLLEAPDHYLAHVEEGLGTKNLVADAVLEQSGVSFYRNLGIDTVATITNDLVTTGALPISVAMHAAVGDGAFFANERRALDLAEGFAEGCRLSGAVWGGGETPALSGIVARDAIVLAGSAIGRIAPKSNRIRGNVSDGDEIVLLASSGVQTNGLTLCRTLASRLPSGYATRIGDGRTYGEALLDPSNIYVPFVAACQKAGLSLHYTAHITGHGWRKLMRLEEPFVYRMTDLGRPPAIFDFLREQGPISLTEAYSTFNMGAGFAAYVAPADTERCLEAARLSGLSAWRGGSVHKEGARKAVVLEPLGITFDEDTLRLR